MVSIFVQDTKPFQSTFLVKANISVFDYMIQDRYVYVAFRIIHLIIWNLNSWSSCLPHHSPLVWIFSGSPLHCILLIYFNKFTVILTGISVDVTDIWPSSLFCFHLHLPPLYHCFILLGSFSSPILFITFLSYFLKEWLILTMPFCHYPLPL